MTTTELKTLEHLHKVLQYAEQNTCIHEETYRGGNIWEICSSCGAKWADDEGGKPDDAHDFPAVLEEARSFLINRNREIKHIRELYQLDGKWHL